MCSSDLMQYYLKGSALAHPTSPNLSHVHRQVLSQRLGRHSAGFQVSLCSSPLAGILPHQSYASLDSRNSVLSNSVGWGSTGLGLGPPPVLWPGNHPHTVCCCHWGLILFLSGHTPVLHTDQCVRAIVSWILFSFLVV